MIRELHTQIEAAHRAIELASQSDQPDLAAQHRARLEDLHDIAARHGIAVSTATDRQRPADPR